MIVIASKGDVLNYYVDMHEPPRRHHHQPDGSIPQYRPPLIKGAPMSVHASPHRSVIANAVYGVLNPIPFGFFVAALIFDIIYLRTAVILWDKGAAWLIAIGLLFAVIPRLVNLAQVWVTSRRSALRADRLDFWLNLIAIVAAIFNAFVHSRDAYASMPTGAWLSAFTVILLAIGRIAIAVQPSTAGRLVHE
jgi:uncharacterized membrane protein